MNSFGLYVIGGRTSTGYSDNGYVDIADITISNPITFSWSSNNLQLTYRMKLISLDTGVCHMDSDWGVSSGITYNPYSLPYGRYEWWLFGVDEYGNDMHISSRFNYAPEPTRARVVVDGLLPVYAMILSRCFLGSSEVG